jgi:hypothetical protein
MAGRPGGYPQAVIMVAGFVLVMAFMLAGFAAMFRLATDMGWSEHQFYAQLRHWGWAGGLGLVLCVVAWCWSLLSSIAILGEARKTPPVQPPNRF